MDMQYAIAPSPTRQQEHSVFWLPAVVLRFEDGAFQRAALQQVFGNLSMSDWLAALKEARRFRLLDWVGSLAVARDS
jgi:hypothetical protein